MTVNPPRRIAPAPMLAFVLALSAGCGGDPTPAGRVAVHPARGKVLFEGRPLAGALVVFEPASPIKSDLSNPTGTTGEDGAFTLSTYEPGDGAPAGDYLVKITTAAMPGSDNGDILAKKSSRGDVLKGRFARAAESGLKAKIGDGPNEMPPFDLK